MVQKYKKLAIYEFHFARRKFILLRTSFVLRMIDQWLCAVEDSEHVRKDMWESIYSSLNTRMQKRSGYDYWINCFQIVFCLNASWTGNNFIVCRFQYNLFPREIVKASKEDFLMFVWLIKSSFSVLFSDIESTHFVLWYFEKVQGRKILWWGGLYSL